MAADPEGAPILEALRATRTTARERQTAMERQARGLRFVLGVAASFVFSGGVRGRC